MKPEAQRIAIAELMWRHVGCPHWVKANHEYSEDALRCMPNYPGDLNAMHEVEKVLTTHQRIEHGKQLQEITNECIVGYVGDYHRELAGLSRVAGASATQRAEAFLRTLNLWKE